MHSSIVSRQSSVARRQSPVASRQSPVVSRHAPTPTKPLPRPPPPYPDRDHRGRGRGRERENRLVVTLKPPTRHRRFTRCTRCTRRLPRFGLHGARTATHCPPRMSLSAMSLYLDARLLVLPSLRARHHARRPPNARRPFARLHLHASSTPSVALYLTDKTPAPLHLCTSACPTLPYLVHVHVHVPVLCLWVLTWPSCSSAARTLPTAPSESPNQPNIRACHHLL
jgi:hypothetical protein